MIGTSNELNKFLEVQFDFPFKLIGQSNRVLKWWRHKNEIAEIMGFVRIFWKNNVQEAYLPKMSISGQIVPEMLAVYTQKTPNPSIFFSVDPKKFRRVCMEFSKHNWATISETICSEMLIFGK